MADETIWGNSSLHSGSGGLNWLHNTTFLGDDHHTVQLPEPDGQEPIDADAPFTSQSILLTRRDGHCLEYQVPAGTLADDALAGILNGRRALITGLELTGTSLTDQGISYLKGMRLLTKLEIDDTAVTDQGVRILAACGLTELRELNLTSTRITDVGVASVSALTRLHHLRLEHTAITNESFKVLRTMSLTILNLGYTAINDIGLIWLQDMPHLRVLSLAGTAITDDGLRHLIRCRRLQVLNLERVTGLTDRSVERLKKKMPGCLIVKPDGMFLN